MTRARNLPSVNALLVALIPWISQECTRSYLITANKHSSQAYITYLPNNQPGIPPPTNDPAWAMNDGGQWKANNPFPVYAIPGSVGATLMNALAQYSGNVTSIPNGTIIAEDYGSPGYVRLYATVGTSSTSNLPSLWEFLLIVLGIVLILIFSTSAIMHIHQRKDRQSLRNRVINGEVDLESLGIKRLTVPKEVLDKLPLYVYNSNENDSGDQPSQASDTLTIPKPAVSPWRPTPNLNNQLRRVSEPLYRTTSPLQISRTTPQHIPSYAQPTCSICLDDFVPHTTDIRELPCHHIYHPACIDQYLRNNSSLCPVCNARVLPQGYCPVRITSAMVRRERQIRQRMAHNLDEEGLGAAATGRHLFLGRRLPSVARQFGRPAPPYWQGSRRISSAPAHAPMRNSLEMTINPVPPALMLQQTIPEGLSVVEPPLGGRRMVSTLLGRGVRDPDEEEGERRARLPKCKFIFSVCLHAEGGH